MRRLTASVLLLILLTGISAPLALALSAVPPHACCVRKGPHCHTMRGDDSQGPALYAPSCPSHSCCRALSATHYAQPNSSAHKNSVPQSQPLFALFNSIYRPTNLTAVHTVRGPPAFFLA